MDGGIFDNVASCAAKNTLCEVHTHLAKCVN